MPGGDYFGSKSGGRLATSLTVFDADAGDLADEADDVFGVVGDAMKIGYAPILTSDAWLLDTRAK